MAARYAALLSLLPPLCFGRDMQTLEQLGDAIGRGPNRKVGFLSIANADAVHTVLPASVERVICTSGYDNGPINCTSTDDMVSLVKDGTLVAGLISGLPPPDQAGYLHQFSSTVVSTRAMLMAPPNTAETPHGPTDAALSSYDLSKAVDAAIVSMQTAGKDEEIRKNNMPFEFMAVHTCKGSDLTAFSVPDKSAATGLLRAALDSKVLKVGALGPYDWGGQDGDYTVTPPVGFYPGWLAAFCDEFNDLSGPDGVKYSSAGNITCERTYKTSSAGVFKDLFDGQTHLTEPYYVVDGFYYGTGETCTRSADCRPAALPAGTETCESGKCAHPASPRTRHFRQSCSTIGVDSTFFTKQSPQGAGEGPKDGASNFPIVAVVVPLSCLVAAAACCMCFMVRRERKGQPLFAAGASAGEPETVGQRSA